MLSRPYVKLTKIAGGAGALSVPLPSFFVPSIGRGALPARRGSATGLLSQAAVQGLKARLATRRRPALPASAGGRKGRKRHAHPRRRGRGTHRSITKILSRNQGAARARRAEREPPGARGARGAASGIGPCKAAAPLREEKAPTIDQCRNRESLAERWIGLCGQLRVWHAVARNEEILDHPHVTGSS